MDEFFTNKMLCNHKAKITEQRERRKDRGWLGCGEEPDDSGAESKDLQGYGDADVLRLVTGCPEPCPEQWANNGYGHGEDKEKEEAHAAGSYGEEGGKDDERDGIENIEKFHSS